MASFAGAMGASRKVTTNLSPISAMPMERGRTASTMGLGKAMPKQKITSTAALISGAMVPPIWVVWA